MEAIDMARKQASKKKFAAGGKGVRTDERRRTTGKAKVGQRSRGARKRAPPRVWRSVAKLAGDALIALEANDVEEAFECLKAIRAVATCADQDWG
jgi:hypothetical protein